MENLNSLCNLLKQISMEADNINLNNDTPSIQTMKDELKQISDEMKKLTYGN